MMHSVAQGECLSSIAHAYGFSDYRALYDHPENEALRRLRPNPSVLHPGDRVFVPEREAKEAESASGAMHRFRLKRPKTLVRLVVRDREGNAIRDTDYVLRVGETELTGTTVGGLVEQPIVATADTALLLIPALGLTMRLQIGHLDPIDTVSGMKARLHNLRYDVGTVDSVHDPRTSYAVRAFQHREGLTTSEDLEETRGALLRKHGS